jgi:hypothetical protein
MSIPSPVPDRRDARIAAAVALLREGVAPAAVVERTRVPFALVEFLAERLDAGALALSRSRTAGVSTPAGRSALSWAQGRLLVAVSLDLVLAVVSVYDHRPTLALVCLLLACLAPMLPLIFIASRHRTGRSGGRHSAAETS